MPRLPDYDLKFDHEQLADITVTMGRLTIDERFELEDVLALPLGDRGQILARNKALREFVAGHLLAWNLEDRSGAAIKPGAEGLKDGLLLDAIVLGWIEGLSGGRGPLPPAPPSEMEESLLAASAPMSEA